MASVTNECQPEATGKLAKFILLLLFKRLKSALNSTMDLTHVTPVADPLQKSGEAAGMVMAAESLICKPHPVKVGASETTAQPAPEKPGAQEQVPVAEGHEPG